MEYPTTQSGWSDTTGPHEQTQTRGELTRRGEPTGDDGRRLARGLAWFSLGLGLAAAALPGQLARLLGQPLNPGAKRMIRGFGARELASGVALLAQPARSEWLWIRAAGDAMDLAGLMAAYKAAGPREAKTNVKIALASVLGVAALDVLAATKLSRARTEAD